MDDFDVNAARKSGYSDKEIAEHLAQQHSFDLENARNSGYQDHEIIQHLTGAEPSPVEPAADVPPSPAMTGAAAALAGAAGKAGQAAITGTANLFSKTPKISPEEARGVQAWINSQLYLHGKSPKNVNIPLHEFEKVPGLPKYIPNTKVAQQVVEALTPTPAARVPVTKTINGVPTVVRYETVPAKPGVDISHLVEKYTPQELSGMRAALAKAGTAISSATPDVIKNLIASPVASKLTRAVAPAVTLGGAGYDLQDALNRWNRGEYGRAITSGVGAGASALAAWPYQPPVARAVEMGVGMAAPAINAAADYVIGDQSKATGGPVHLADGGQPKKSVARQWLEDQQAKLKEQAQEPWHPAQEWNQNVQSMVTAPANVAKGLIKLATNPKQWAKDLPVPTAEQMAMSFNPGSVGMAGIIKPKGGNWHTDVKSVIEPYHHDMVLEGLKRDQELVDKHAANNYSNELANAQLKTSKEMKAINDWARGNLTNYIKNEMGTSEDPVRALHEQGITHLRDFTIENMSGPGHSITRLNRAAEGMPQEATAITPHGQAWENLSDDEIRAHAAKDYLKDAEFGAPEPWLHKLDPETKLYSLAGDSTTRRLGFDDLMYHLENELASGKLRPEQLNKISVPDAIKRMHSAEMEKIKQKEAAQQAARAGLPVHKAYDNGYKWIELNKPGSFANESEAMGHSVRGYEPPVGHPDWIPESGEMGHPSYGHGGWEAIKSGKAKVYSLIDEKGQPHATIEARPNQHLDFNKWWDQQPQELRNDINARARQGEHGGSVFEAPEYLAAREALPPEITQIKGKGNAAVIDKYHPYVQDFLNSKEWGNVSDKDNASVIDASRFSPEIHEHAAKLGLKLPRFIDVADEFDLMHHHSFPDEPAPETLNKYKVQPAAPEPVEHKMLQGVYRGYAGEAGAPEGTLFATPQKRVADYYAEKRAGQTGEAPHVDMLMIDPFAGRTYGHSTMGTGAQEPMFTQAKKLAPEDVQSQTQLYAEGGLAHLAEGGYSTPAWQRAEGKNPEGGLNAKGRASYHAETGGTLKAPQSSGPRHDSFCARMKGNPGPMKDENGKPTRKALSLRKWKC